MRVALITVGSRGDAEPFCALAEALGDAGHNVDLWLQTDMQQLAPPSARTYELPFTCVDFYKFVGANNPARNHPNPRVQFTGVIAEVCGELVLPCTKQVLKEICCNGKNEHNNKPPIDVIVASSLARHIGMVLSSKLGHIPICLVQLQPLVPTRDFPHSSHINDFIQAIVNKEKTDKGDDRNMDTYWELEEYQYKFIQERWEATYRDVGITSDSDIPTFDYMKRILSGNNNKSNVVLINAFSDKVIPTCSDHHNHDNIWNIGALADDYLPSQWKPPQDLVDFLSGNETKPVCVGYGSMPFEKTEMILEALRQTDERAVLVGSAMRKIKLEDGYDAKQIFVIDSVPYSFLLPRCSMMLSHGGAGVVHATVRAGIPSVISPLIGDQFFYAKLLQVKGLGVAAGSLTELSVDDLVESITKAKDCTNECQNIGSMIRKQESGTKILVKALQKRFGA